MQTPEYDPQALYEAIYSENVIFRAIQSRELRENGEINAAAMKIALMRAASPNELNVKIRALADLSRVLMVQRKEDGAGLSTAEVALVAMAIAVSFLHLADSDADKLSRPPFADQVGVIADDVMAYLRRKHN